MKRDDKPPFLKLFVQDFAASSKVEAMPTLGVGCYILLICKAWHQDPPCSLPNDDSTLARWSRCSLEEWSSVKSAVLSCWELRADGRLYQRRLEREWRDMREAARVLSESGRRGAAKRWSSDTPGNRVANGEANRVAIATPMPPQWQSEFRVQSSDKNQVSECAGACEAAVPPDDDPDNPILAVERLAKRPLRHDERRAIAEEEQRQSQAPAVYIAGQSVPALDLWRRCVDQVAREPEFKFSTATAMLRYVGSMQARCVDEGVWPEAKRERATYRPTETMDADAVAAGLADGLKRAEARRAKQ